MFVLIAQTFGTQMPLGRPHQQSWGRTIDDAVARLDPGFRRDDEKKG